jgi:uncharacterized protein
MAMAAGISAAADPEATPSEKAIRSDPALSELDSAMQQVLSDAEGALGEAQREAYTQKQKDWLAVRDGCGPDVACLKSALEKRLLELRSGARPATVGPVALRWEARGSHWIPQIEKGAQKKAKEKVNSALRSFELEPVLDVLGISVNNGYLTVSYCGEGCGAYCAEYCRQGSWSLQTGDAFPRTEYIGSEGKESRMLHASLTSEVLFALAQKYDPKRVDLRSDEDGCGADDVVGYGFLIGLSKDGSGFSISSEHPHAVRACSWSAWIPFKALEPYLTGEAKGLARKLAARCVKDTSCTRAKGPELLWNE